MRLALPWRLEPKPPPPIAAERFEQNSMALEHVMTRLEDAPRCGVLDLGAPVAANLELYARHNAKITFADFFHFYEPQHPNAASVAASLPATTYQVDIIFAWDVLNYLSLDEISWLGESVRSRCAPGALLLALVSCSGPMPFTPSNHTILDEATLRIETDGSSARPSPAYSEHALLTSLGSATVQSRFQLRSAMVEYLFCWE